MELKHPCYLNDDVWGNCFLANGNEWLRTELIFYLLNKLHWITQWLELPSNIFFTWNRKWKCSSNESFILKWGAYDIEINAIFMIIFSYFEQIKCIFLVEKLFA